MKREDYDTAIGMLHLNVAAFAMDLDKAEPFEGCEDLLS